MKNIWTEQTKDKWCNLMHHCLNGSLRVFDYNSLTAEYICEDERTLLVVKHFYFYD